MKPFRPFILIAAAVLACASVARAQQEPETAVAAKNPAESKAKPFEISHGNLFEALRQLAAYRKLDLVIDPDVPNHKGLYAFKHTTWEKALESLLASHELGGEIKDRILHVGPAMRFQSGGVHSVTPVVERIHPSRSIAIIYHPSAGGDAVLSVSVNEATRAEILDALAKVENLAKAKPDQRSFNVNWVLRPRKGGSPEDLETFSMEDVTPSGLRALYP